MPSKSKKANKQGKRAKKPTMVLLVRHGQNDWVGKNKLAGWTPGVHLNKQGARQAKAIGKRLAQSDIKIDAIYASPLERTMETAQAIADKLDLSITSNKRIGEVDYGDWTGKSLKKLYDHPDWPVIQFYPSKARFPEGESILGMQTRAVEEINRLVKKHQGQTLLLVSHADIIKSVVAHYLGLHLDLFQRIVISTASITTITFTFMRPFVQSLNDTSHLSAKSKSA